MNDASKNRGFLSRFGRWAAELVLVFVGVYAAFWLSNYQQHRQDAKRRDQILAALEEEVRAALDSTKSEGGRQRESVADFHRALDAGEMPPVRAFAFSTDYSPTDIATLLQAGGVELLNAKTLITLRDTESLIRGGLSRLGHYEKLSDELIAPNLDQDASFFYDPATKKLRKKFEFYLRFNDAGAKFFSDMEKAQTDLLKQIQAERQRR